MKHLDPVGAACIIEAQHLCMMIRGVEKQHSKMVTSSLEGSFHTDPSARSELMRLIGK
jgi:GTP cyclohydrolase I